MRGPKPSALVKIVRSPAAENDLFAIFDYGVSRWGVDEALAFVLSFEAADELLAEHPVIGRLRPDLGEEIRSWLHQGHIIYYRFDRRLMKIIRILHGAVDPGPVDDWH